MKKHAVSLTVLVLWLGSGFGFVAPSTTTTAAVPLQEAASGMALQAQAVVQPPSADSDYDGLTDAVETIGWQNSAGTYATDANDADSDDDGLTDGEEKLFETDPLDDTSPGIYVEYQGDLETSKYFSWLKFGTRFIAFDSAVVRRGARIYIGGPSDASIQIIKSKGTLTTLTAERHACGGGWLIDIPTNGTVGKYTITLERGSWSQNLLLYIIFELPSNLTDAEVAAYTYSDDPNNFRDEYAIWFYATNDYMDSWELWPPYHIAKARGMAFQTDYYKPYVFEEHVIDVINGHTDVRNAATALGHEVDETLRFNSTKLRYNMWSALHSSNQLAQCSTHASVLTGFLRGAGIAARPVQLDYDMYVVGPMLFDHSTEVWISNDWQVMRAYRRDESDPDDPPDAGIRDLKKRDRWFYGENRGDIIAVGDANWVWEQTETNNGDRLKDYFFANYDNSEIVRWDWVKTQVLPYGWNWPREPQDVGDPYVTQIMWPTSAPTPSIILQTAGNGSATKTPDQSSYSYHDIVTIEAFPDPGWYFVDWTGDFSSTNNPATVTIRDENDLTITANFAPYEYTLTVNTSGNGSVTKTPDQPTYHYNDNVTLEAIPHPPWSFSQWTGDLSGSQNPATITIYGDTAVTAVFTKTNQGGTSAFVDPISAAVSSSHSVGRLFAQDRELEPSAVQLGDVVADYGVDLDGDGHFDQLVLEVEVYAEQPGYYTIGALLDSPDFDAYAHLAAMASAKTYTYLQAGHQAIQLAFDGTSLSTTHVDGPYVITQLWVSDLTADADLVDLFANLLDHKDPQYTTSSYGFAAFDDLGASFTGQFSERGVDSERDGQYESLTIDVGWTSSIPGSYTIVGDLYDVQGNFVARTTWTGTDSPASLHFDEIRGTTGPYVLGELYLMNADEEIIDSSSQVYTTQTVIKSEGKTHIVDGTRFDTTDTRYIEPSAYTDAGVDLDGDGLYDLLAIDVQVQIEQADDYRLEGWLEGPNGGLVSWATTDSSSLDIGTHTLTLNFSGLAINAHRAQGSFTLMALQLLKGAGYEPDDQVDVAYTTAVYSPDQFESAPKVDLPPDQELLLEDDLEDGATGWTAESPWALATFKSHSPTHAWTDSPNAKYANSQNLSLDTPTVNLSQFGAPMLQFQTCYDLETDYDHGYVEFSTDGAQWTTAATYTGKTTAWTRETVSLGAIADSDTLQVRFRLDTDGSVAADGWYIDDVVIVSDNDVDDDGIPNYVEVGGDPANPVDTDDDGTPDYGDTDSDDDTIPDAVEAGADPTHPVDSDGDNAPDYVDTDSDADGIPDSVEAGADPPHPVDSDGDNTPDYLDTDSDADGIPDALEAGAEPVHPVDSDNDGTPDYIDTDSDNDWIYDAAEAGTDPTHPRDTDNDNTPDYLDIDSDNDRISDAAEAGDRNRNTPPVNTDKHGKPDYLDTDSDNDTILDRIEAGDNKLNTPPYDTDRDGVPNYIDTDSDNDNIPDAGEWSSGPNDRLIGCTAADPICTKNDADGDGVQNYRDKDSDNDTALDLFEGTFDLDKDGIPDFLDADTVVRPRFYLPTIAG